MERKHPAISLLAGEIDQKQQQIARMRERWWYSPAAGDRPPDLTWFEEEVNALKDALDFLQDHYPLGEGWHD